jgi:hypothetical protein
VLLPAISLVDLDTALDAILEFYLYGKDAIYFVGIA